MKRHISVARRITVGILALSVLTGCSGNFAEFWTQTEVRPAAQSSGPTGTELQFLGVSSFLLRAGDTRIMIDGFITRPKSALIKPLQPSEEVVRGMLRRLRVATPSTCTGPLDSEFDLDAIFAVHGHYDHALDTPLVAGLTGAELVADGVVGEIADRTAYVYPALCPIRRGPTIDIANYGGQQIHTYGSITLRLIKVPHSDNPASTLLERLPKNPDWQFPTSAKNLKEGDGVAVHITTPHGTILIVPTAGHVDEILQNSELSADILFLGIGGLGWGSRSAAIDYFKGTILVSGAKYVVPIHWDRHSPPLDEAQDELPIPGYENLDRALRLLDAFSEIHPHFALASVPLLAPFDPFSFPSMQELP